MSHLLTEFKQFYESFDQQSLQGLNSLYAEDIVFVDPLHVIKGRKHLVAYFKSLCGNLTQCQFKFLEETVTDKRACYKWVMQYRHPKIKKNTPLQLTGITIIEYSDKIDRHQDFYDMGAMLYEQIPILGNVTRWLRLRLAS